jgi:hypothetical protein
VDCFDQRPRPDVVAARGTITPHHQPDERTAHVRRLPDRSQSPNRDSRLASDFRHRSTDRVAHDRYADAGHRDPSLLPRHAGASSATHGMIPPYGISSTGHTPYPSWYEMAYHQPALYQPVISVPFHQQHGALLASMPMYQPLMSPPMAPQEFGSWSDRGRETYASVRRREAD